MNIVKRQGGINTILIYVGIGIGVVNTFLRARAITAEEIGVISTITTLTGMIEFFINFGLPPAITRFYALPPGAKPGQIELCGLRSDHPDRAARDRVSRDRTFPSAFHVDLRQRAARPVFHLHRLLHHWRRPGDRVQANRRGGTQERLREHRERFLVAGGQPAVPGRHDDVRYRIRGIFLLHHLFRLYPLSPAPGSGNPPG